MEHIFKIMKLADIFYYSHVIIFWFMLSYLCHDCICDCFILL